MRHRNRRTACLSSQSGCPLACTFCATGAMGLGRNLTAGEIVEQLLVLARLLRDAGGGRIANVVMMGMGEPFLNYDAVLDACRTITDPAGYGLGARHIAISTAGWVPGIERLAAGAAAGEARALAARPDRRAAHDADAGDEALPARTADGAPAATTARSTGRRVFVEYLLLDGVNDSDGDARRARPAARRGEGFHVNLIAYNPTAAGYRGLAARAGGRVRGRAAPPRRRDELPALARGDIEAACGQLAVAGAGARRRELRRAAVR